MLKSLANEDLVISPDGFLTNHHQLQSYRHLILKFPLFCSAEQFSHCKCLRTVTFMVQIYNVLPKSHVLRGGAFNVTAPWAAILNLSSQQPEKKCKLPVPMSQLWSLCSLSLRLQISLWIIAGPQGCTCVLLFFPLLL